MRVYPALRIAFFEHPSEEQMDFLLALLDDFRPTAINDTENGVIAYFGNPSVRDEALAHLGSYELVDVTPEDVPDENWAERSQAALTPVTVGRLTIAPPWSVTDEFRATAPGPVIVILPSMGFGTGHHATTRLCLELLQQVPLDGKRVLDIGTGSGVLAIAARTLGAPRVVGIDVDPDALRNALENAALNHLGDSIAFQDADLSGRQPIPGAPFDLVMANLTGGLLVRDSARIARLAEPGASLILSGYQRHELDEVTEAFRSQGCRVQMNREEESWAATMLTR